MSAAHSAVAVSHLPSLCWRATLHTCHWVATCPKSSLQGLLQPNGAQLCLYSVNTPMTRGTAILHLAPCRDQISKYEADRLKVQQLSHLQEAPAQQQVCSACVQLANSPGGVVGSWLKCSLVSRRG